jgi:nucleotide-binding universal stress UspA family protein
MSIEHILLATDFSRQAEWAEAYACELAEVWGAKLTVLTVLEFDPELNPESPVAQLYLNELSKQAQDALETVRMRIAGRGIAVEPQIVRGLPSKEIVATAEAQHTDCLVVGTAGKSGLEHVLLGSTAERVIRTAPCPVLAVPTKREPLRGSAEQAVEMRPSLKKMVIPVDFSDCSLDALEYGVVMARSMRASMTLLHVLEPVSYGLDFTLVSSHARQRRDVIERRLADIAQAVRAGGISCDFVVRGGLPNDSILEVAKSLPADWLVMGTHGRRGLAHALYGSVVEFVLRQSPCPILTVRSPKFRPGHRRVLTTSSAGEGSS